jgi:hypothetical protein
MALMPIQWALSKRL